MDKRFLEDCLAQGMSLEAIGERAGKHPSTVGYWLKKHGLRAHGSAVHAPRGGIEKSQLVGLIEEGLSLREIAERLDRSVTAVRYWIDHYGIKRERCRRRVIPGVRRRKRCCVDGMDRLCSSWRVEARIAARDAGRMGWGAVVGSSKRTLVEEAGGRCVICGYSRCLRALQFHHLDPASKEFHLGHAGHCRSLARSRAEARKCALLCANCHAEVEAGLIAMPLNSLVEADPG